MYVIRKTAHPAEDLKRNWSAEAGGGDLVADDIQSVEEYHELMEERGVAEEDRKEVRFHPAYDCFVEVHYEGLGAWQLEAENLSDAIEEAKNIEPEDLATTSEAGDGHFFAENVVNYHKVNEDLYIYEIKK